MKSAALVFAILYAFCGHLSSAQKPNILWILVDDMSPNFCCYGEPAIRTPNVDALAAEGTRFSSEFVTAPICSISRSALITGRYQTSIGCQNHRSGSAKFPITLAADTPVVAQLFKKAGYHTCNVSFDVFMRAGADAEKPTGIAKTDYNFVWDRPATFDTTHWSRRADAQPFFAQIQLHGGKHRGQKPGPQWPKKV